MEARKTLTGADRYASYFCSPGALTVTTRRNHEPMLGLMRLLTETEVG